ncbi:MAG: aspartyl/glutamyl-tRNA amidotransferase subunit C [Treponema sp.]|jgi:aspartyl-tRNA(Asn)/glutamyl-tRNA(Gln) amidotransferase subunit C|nr:aspartyl/glutamyl-tRNA amidotransferase subunit C [Treponema sp.]
MGKSVYMKIEDLRETAALARLNMDEKELAAAFPAFEQMLEYFAAMQAADRDGAGAAGSGVSGGGGALSGLSAVSKTVASAYFRPDDAAGPAGDSDLNERLLDNAGGRDGRFLVIPNVL